jgi:hypothetical protein
VDLSSTGPEEDGYGAWDLELSFPAINGRWVWPYVEDMNSDGRADFVAYDKEHGTFYVALTDTNLIRNGIWHGWDWVIDYSSQWKDELAMDPDQAKYSRPALGNYNADIYNDIAITTSDGKVRVDYGSGIESSFGYFEWTPQLLTSAMLAAAPGWAYLIVPEDFNAIGQTYFAVKVPDTLPDEGRMYIIPQDGTNFLIDADWMANSPHIFGGNDAIPLTGAFDGPSAPMVSIKEPDGQWRVTLEFDYNALIVLPPSNVYGGNECHPITADFDGDFLMDRAVMCPEEWRIAYSSSDTFKALRDLQGVRHVPLLYDPASFALPGRTYSGGVSYKYTRQLIELFKQLHPGVPPPIPVDMVTTASCSPAACQ